MDDVVNIALFNILGRFVHGNNLKFLFVALEIDLIKKMMQNYCVPSFSHKQENIAYNLFRCVTILYNGEPSLQKSMTDASLYLP